MRVSKDVAAPATRAFTLTTAVVAIAACFSTAAFAATYVVPKDETLIRRASVIVTARALTSYVEETTERDIETVTVFTVDGVMKGGVSAGDELKVRVGGGVTSKRIKVLFDAPRFHDGERVLLFLTPDSGDYAITDFGLGSFSFSTDENGKEILIRTTNTISGWDLDGSVHHELRRDAERFVGFIRGVNRSLPVIDNYTVEDPPAVPDPSASLAKLRPVTNTVPGTSRSYTMPSADENSAGFRWLTFPSVVNWNKGNSETCASCNGGSDAINVAFASWNNEATSNINYVFASSTANLNGSKEAADGVNNIVFEKAMVGIAAFSCGGGGTLGVGGITSGTGADANGDPANTVGGFEFFTTVEGDVSMNVGVGPCIGAGLAVGDYNSAVTHEFGHTLGFRHSDQVRATTTACTTIAAYDCSSSAIMTGTITPGLLGALTAWEQRAAHAVYPSTASPYNPPTNVEAHVNTSTTALISWTAATGTVPGRYNVYRSLPNNYTVFSQVGNTAGTSISDAVTSGNAYLYKVRSADAAGANESTDSNLDLATIVIYTNPTLTAFSSIVNAADMNELRTAVNSVRTLYGIGAGSYSFTITGHSTIVRAIDMNELRTNLNTPVVGMGLTAPSYTNTISSGGTIKALDFNQVRTALR